MARSVCPICGGVDGFPQTISNEKVYGNAFITSSQTVETQYVFCKQCRVQLEPMLTWEDFKLQREKDRIAKLPKEQRSLLEAKKGVNDIEGNILSNWILTVFVYILGIVFSIMTDNTFLTPTVFFLAVWTAWFAYWLNDKKREIAKFKKLIEGSKNPQS